MSLRTRLLLVLGAVALVALVVADVVTYQELRSFLYGQIDQTLEASHIPIESALSGGNRGPGGPGGGSNAPPGTGGPGLEADGGANGAGPVSDCPSVSNVPEEAVLELAPGTFVQVRRANGSVVVSCTRPGPGSSGSAHPLLPPQIVGLIANAADFHEPTTYLTAPSSKAGGAAFRVRVSMLRAGPYAGGQLVLAVPLGSTTSTLGHLIVVELAVTGAALAGAILLGWWLVRVGLRPLRGVEQTAQAIARGELAERVPGDQARTEVGHLARALNVMLERIQGAFAQRDATEAELRASEARMRQFVGDASHELRTPLAAVSAYAELFDQGASVRADDLNRVMHGIRDETARMGRLVGDLLLLARLDEGRPLEREDVELVGMAAEAVRTATTVGPAWPVRLDARQPVEVVGDRSRLRQVMDNLLANVRAHTPPGTSTVVTVAREGAEAVVTVADDGPGIDEVTA
ncbi:MAG TPA: HAMP domain-containing sensor histidine kinase, partial [Acidimicrobiales bacterium]|nr:HAMP domain-containing sensor histidine kinase [Acidimicrobiales bacterium]